MSVCIFICNIFVFYTNPVLVFSKELIATYTYVCVNCFLNTIIVIENKTNDAVPSPWEL